MTDGTQPKFTKRGKRPVCSRQFSESFSSTCNRPCCPVRQRFATYHRVLARYRSRPAHLRVGMRFVFADCVFAAVNDCHVFVEEAYLGIVEGAAVRRAGPFSSRSSSSLLKRSPCVLVPWKSSANNSEITPLLPQTPSAHLRSMSIMNFAVLSSACCRMALLCIGARRKDCDAHQVQHSVMIPRPSSVRVTIQLSNAPGRGRVWRASHPVH